MIYKAFKLPEGDAETSYDDVTENTRYNFEIAAVTRAGIFEGDKNEQGLSRNTFRPNDPINRAETVKVILTARETVGTPGSAQR